MRFSPGITLVALTAAAVVSLALALAFGSGEAGPAEVANAFLHDSGGSVREVVMRLRLPRALAAFGTGACLALAGVLMQALLRNPLADPYILGTSGGAAVATLIVMLAGLSGALVNAAAFTGSLASTLLVFGLARTGRSWAPSRLLLTGVVVAAGWSALISLLLATSPETNLRGILFWLMGDFSFAGNPLPPLLTAAAATIVALLLGRSLNLLTTGDLQASLLGLRVGPVRAAAYFLSAALTAVAVTTAGTVGFVGLVVPHGVRLLSGADHRSLIPGSVLAGGTLLVLADTLARTVLAPRQLPVGAITAMIGVPLFLVLLRRDAASRGQ